jgi:phosphoglycerate dehydrogenase-like enzyme
MAPNELYAFLQECDFLVVTAPLTPVTRGVFDARAFAAMKPSAYFVCISRGGIAVDADLLAALRTGQIRGAGLDAHGIEPLPADSPFWNLPNVIITPHNGATTPGTLQRQADIFLDNLARFVRGEQLHNVVDKPPDIDTATFPTSPRGGIHPDQRGANQAGHARRTAD